MHETFTHFKIKLRVILYAYWDFMGVSPKTRNKLSISQMSAVLTHHHFSKHTISDSDLTILTSGDSKFDLEMSESPSILKPNLNNNISSTPLYLF